MRENAPKFGADVTQLIRLHDRRDLKIIRVLQSYENPEAYLGNVRFAVDLSADLFRRTTKLTAEQVGEREISLLIYLGGRGD